MRIIPVLLFLLCTASLSAADYYVDSLNGSDAADGRSPQTAWKSTDRINTADLKPGDKVLFRRGGLWRGHISCRAGSESAPIYYGTYGEGRAPVLLGSVSLTDPDSWLPPSDPEQKIWVTRPGLFSSENVGNIILTPKGKLPADPNRLYLDDTARKAAWKRWSQDELKSQDDYFFDYNTNQIFYYSGKNPADLYDEIEAAPNGAMISAASFVTIEHLSLGFCGGHGIAGSPAEGVTIRDCTLFWIGGSELRSYPSPHVRYGNGIEFWDHGKNHTVEGCRFREIYDTAMTIQGPSPSIYQNIVWRNNTVDRSEQSFEIWLSHPDSEIHNMVFEGNICRNAGFGWGHEQRPNKNGTHLLGYQLKSKVLDVTIRGNLFSRGRDGLVMYWNSRLGELNINENRWEQPEAGGIPGIEQPLFIWGIGSAEEHKVPYEEYRALTGNDADSEFFYPPCF